MPDARVLFYVTVLLTDSGKITRYLQLTQGLNRTMEWLKLGRSGLFLHRAYAIVAPQETYWQIKADWSERGRVSAAYNPEAFHAHEIRRLSR